MTSEDIHFQLVDLPAVSREHPVPWLASAPQTADAGGSPVSGARRLGHDGAGTRRDRALRVRSPRDRV